MEKMNFKGWLIKRGEAPDYPRGTMLQAKATGEMYRIECQCFCGDYLHYEVSKFNQKTKYNSVYQHSDIERLFIIKSKGDERSSPFDN